MLIYAIFRITEDGQKQNFKYFDWHILMEEAEDARSIKQQHIALANRRIRKDVISSRCKFIKQLTIFDT